MHEVSVMSRAIEMAADLAREQGAKTIHRLALRVGVYSGVDPQALRFAFDAAAADTPAAHAILEVDEIAARCWCESCAAEFDPPGPLFECPRCGTVSADLRQGGELELATVEVS